MEQELFSKELMDTPLDDTNTLYHWGVKGMKWGVRRYVNKDGSLTDAGKKRYSRDSREREYHNYDDEKGVYYKQSKNGRSDNVADANRYVKEDMERSKRLTDAGSGMTRELSKINDREMRRSQKQMDLSKMSDKEMRDQINRAMLERQYNDMFNASKNSRGREFAKRSLEVAGDVLAVTGSALTIALAIRELKGGTPVSGILKNVIETGAD